MEREMKIICAVIEELRQAKSRRMQRFAREELEAHITYSEHPALRRFARRAVDAYLDRQLAASAPAPAYA